MLGVEKPEHRAPGGLGDHGHAEVTASVEVQDRRVPGGRAQGDLVASLAVEEHQLRVPGLGQGQLGPDGPLRVAECEPLGFDRPG